METENVSDRPDNISVSLGLRNVIDRYGTDQKAIRYNGNIVLVMRCFDWKIGVFQQTVVMSLLYP